MIVCKVRLYEQVFQRQFGAFLGGFLDPIPDTDDTEHFLVWGDEQGRAFAGGPVERAAPEGSNRPADPVHPIVSLIGVCVYPFVAHPVLEKVIPGLGLLLSPGGLEKRKEEVFDLFWEGLRIPQ